jgi:CHAT domain-containing protein
MRGDQVIFSLHRIVPVCSVLALSSFVFACQSTRTVSLEEAKDITAAQSDVAFVAPPRSVEDVTAILNQQKIAEPEMMEKDQAFADKKPPPGADEGKLAKFFNKRGAAARKVGRSAQTLTDYRKAAKYAALSDINPKTVHNIYKNLAFAERSAGNYKSALKAIHSALAARETPVIYRAFAQIQARSGNFAAAEQARDDALVIIQRMRSKRRIPAKASFNLDIEELSLKILILEMQGKWAEAEPYRRDEIARLQASSFKSVRPSRIAGRQKELTENLIRQGRIVEAEVIIRQALLEFLAKLGKSNEMTALLARTLAEVMLVQGRLEEAQELSTAALKIMEAAKTPSGSKKIALAHRTLGSALAADGEWADAMVEFDRMTANLKSKQAAKGSMITSQPSAVITLIKTGRAGEARGYLLPKYKGLLKKLGKKHPTTSMTAVLLAMSYAALGNDQEALKGFRSALPNYLSRSRPREEESEINSTKKIWRAAILESYIDLLARVQNSGQTSAVDFDLAEEAFRMAEVARGGSVQRAVAASGARTFASNPELADYVRREQDARKRIAALFNRLADALGAPTDQQDAAVITDLKIRIDDLRTARAALMEELEKGFPEYANLINPKPPTFTDLQKTLRSGEALLSFYIGTERSYVWAVPEQGRAHFQSINIGYDELDDIVYHLRGALEPRAGSSGATPNFDFDVAYDLYRQFLKPLEPTLQSSPNLLVVAHGPIGWLPLSLLPTEPFSLSGDPKIWFANYRSAPWLVKRHAVTLIPSVSSLETLRLLPAGDPKRQAFIGFGDPVFDATQAKMKGPVEISEAPSETPDTGKPTSLKLRAAPATRGLEQAGLSQLPRLPETATEMKSMARALGSDDGRNLFLEQQASESRVKTTDLTQYRVVAFATHGLVPGDLDGLVQPALALSSPVLTGGADDGLLTMGEILGLRMDADWVVLSACNTASGDGAGAEAVSGLGRAFFYAGTRALLVSNWPVQSDSAMALTTGIFSRQASDPALPRTEALRQSMLELINSGGFKDAEGVMKFSYAHPLFWAPFALMGDG